MRKITLAFVIWSTCFFTGSVLWSQVAIYTFSQTIGSYNAISGGTVFGTATSDDQVFLNTTNLTGLGVGSTGPGLPIGFSFVFNGVAYDRIGINCNGFIYLGQSSQAPAIESQMGSAFTPISSTTAVSPLKQQKISAFARDLEAQASSEIRMEVLGSSPNSTMVVQWSNYKKYNQTGDSYNFQLRLCQTTNAVEVVYGSFVNNGIASTVQVGLRGQNLSDYNNRFVNAINIWSISAKGNAVNALASVDNALLPTNGLTFRWEPAPVCTGSPSANNVLASLTTICPNGSSTLSLAGTYTNSGITYQWLASNTTSNGAYAPISPGGNGPVYQAGNVASSTWYKCAITCTNGGAITYAGPLLVSTIGSIVNSVPYSEDFENIILGNSLPNCSWATSASTAVCQTYTTLAANSRIPHTGNKFASFKSPTNSGGDYFYTNAIKLYAGINYSASVWFISDGNAGWTDLSLMFGTAQAASTLTHIASTTNPVGAISYQQISNSFTVQTTGNYFIAIKCVGATPAQYLSFDDLSVTAPCNLNTPPMSFSASSSTICNGQTTTLSVTGANTYTWTGGVNGPSVSVTPSTSTTYYVIGSNTLSNCTNTLSHVILVNPSPALSISSATQLCSGKTTTLIASGALTYSWDNGATTPSVLVSPSVNTVYTVVASNSFNCSSTLTRQVMVLQSPVISVLLSPTVICLGDNSMLTGQGAEVYEWKAVNLYSTNNPVTVGPTTSTTYSVAGTNSLGCTSTSTVSLRVEACVGVNGLYESDGAIEIFPNPFVDTFKVRLTGNDWKLLTLIDACGRQVYQWSTIENEYIIKTNELSSGFYYLTVKAKSQTKNVRLIKL